MSDSASLREPCVLVPVGLAEILDANDLGNCVKELCERAWFAEALSTADHIVINATTPRGYSRALIDLDMIASSADAIDRMRAFSGKDPMIDNAIGILDFSAEEAERKSERRIRSKSQSQRTRSELRSKYNEIFVMIGRRDGFFCSVCSSHGSDLQIDHVIPVSKGGTNDLGNLQLLCRDCNILKSDGAL